MSTKSKLINPLNGLHTAGIFSDMSIDGPDIGTLVLIIDRAKNLPNRKTIGKQDPYCAARLGKEAKKTTTDIRGGQTPKWDQELRFPVHDSPDYYQLKLSVFNDDKRTELIGETWIDLRDIVVLGGGQSDHWHTLNCRGKYAGDIRIEITYYDSRPKAEKPAAASSPAATASDSDLVTGAQKSPVKRRPLPSDPITGQAPSPSVPEPLPIPPRAQPHPPVAFVPNQSPLQFVEYGFPSSGRHSSQTNSYSPAPSGSQHATPIRAQRSSDRNDKSPAYENEPIHLPDAGSLSRPYDLGGPRTPLNHSQPSHESPASSTFRPRQQLEDDDRPPPPPAHRVGHTSGNSLDMTHRSSLDLSQHKSTPPMRHDVLRSEAHRLSISSPSSSYPGRPTYRPFDSAPDMQNLGQHPDADSHSPSPARHHSYDSAYEPHQRSLQPTVEDVPESWTPPNSRPHHRGSSHGLPYNDRDNSRGPDPAPLNFGERDSASSGHHNPRHSQNQIQTQNHNQNQNHYNANSYNSSPSPASSGDYSQALTHVPRLYSSRDDEFSSYPNELDNNHIHASDSYELPPVPPTLVPGVDPTIAREISTRFHQERDHERRYTQPAPLNLQHRGRQHSEPPSHYAAGYPPHTPYQITSRNSERALVTYSSGPSTPSGPPRMSEPLKVSPSPTASYIIKRKSVSPAPAPSDSRRLSGVPFGPDSYDALNTSLASSKQDPKSSEYTNADGKIVTSDGREIDPSDHLPMDTWAPEPEPKKPALQLDTRSRPPPPGAQPNSSSGRRQLRIAPRPQSMGATPPSYIDPDVSPSPPISAGRNRLQKKHRGPALPAPLSSGSSPLGPTTAHKRNSTPPRALVRASTYDYENYEPPYGNETGFARPGYGSGPPIPAKVPVMSGGLGPSYVMPRASGDDWALMEEMSRIDIGTGRARRHGRY